MKGKTTFREAAVTVLEAVGRPLHYKDMMREIIDRGIMNPSGKTPAETLRAMMMRDIKAEEPTFGFFGDGRYGMRHWSGTAELPDPPLPKDEAPPRRKPRPAASDIPRHPHPPRPDRKLIGRIGEGDDGTFLLAWIRREQERFLEISQILEDQKASDSPMGSILVPVDQIGSIGRNLLILAGEDALQDLFSQLAPHELPGAVLEHLMDEESEDDGPTPTPEVKTAVRPTGVTAAAGPREDPGAAQPDDESPARVSPGLPAPWHDEIRRTIRTSLVEELPRLLDEFASRELRRAVEAPRRPEDGPAAENPEESEPDAPAPHRGEDEMDVAPSPEPAVPPPPSFCSVPEARNLGDVMDFLARHHDLPPLEQFHPDLTLNPLRSIDTLDRFEGCLLGFAIGDSMGLPLRGLDPEGIRERFGASIYGNQGGEAALPTRCDLSDDTRILLAACRHLLEGDFRPDELAYSLVDLDLRETPSTLHAFRRKLRDGHLPWYACGLDSDRIDGAKRSLPFGLVHLGDFRKLRSESALSAFIIQRDDIALAAAIATATSVALCCTTSDGLLSDPERLLRFCETVGQAIAGVERHPHRESIGTRELTLHERLARQLPRVLLDEGLGPEQIFARWHCGAHALEALPVALYCFLRSPDDFQNTLVTAVTGGGESHSVAALACAFSGAYNGLSAIPHSLLEGFDGQDRVKEIARDLHARHRRETSA